MLDNLVAKIENTPNILPVNNFDRSIKIITYNLDYDFIESKIFHWLDKEVKNHNSVEIAVIGFVSPYLKIPKGIKIIQLKKENNKYLFMDYLIKKWNISNDLILVKDIDSSLIDYLVSKEIHINCINNTINTIKDSEYIHNIITTNKSIFFSINSPKVHYIHNLKYSNVYKIFNTYEIANKNIDVMFLTSNLNSGGAQRSLVNLLLENSKKPKINSELVVCRKSTQSFFSNILLKNNINTTLLTEQNDVFTIFQSLMNIIQKHHTKKLCLWNVDAKIKILLTKYLPKTIELIEVSPGNNAFLNLEKIKYFHDAIGVEANDFYSRLNKIVYKYQENVLDNFTNIESYHIPNGVYNIDKTNHLLDHENPIFMVSGRIDQNKYIIEIIKAFNLLKNKYKNAELHIYGQCEDKNIDYLKQVLRVSNRLKNVKFKGHATNLEHLKNNYHGTIIIGYNQGCPNAALESLVAGIPVIANDSGGTKEAIINNETGLLIKENFHIQDIFYNMKKLYENEQLRLKIIKNGLNHVENNFSMTKMLNCYSSILSN